MEIAQIESAANDTRGAQPPAPEQEVNLLDILIALAEAKSFILKCGAAFGLVAVVIVLLLRNNYTATAVIMPPQAQQSSLMTLMGLSPLSGLSSGGFSLKDPNAIYIGILEGRTITDDMIAKFDLQNVYKKKYLSDARKSLASHANIVSGKDSLISIAVTDHDPKRAADMANAFVSELYNQNSRLAITESAHRRVFLESQLTAEKNALADAEVELEKTQEKTGIIQMSGQAEATIRAIAELRANITIRQVQLQGLEQSATSQNPEVIRLKTEIGGLQEQLQKLEQSNGGGSQPGNVFMPTAKVPEAGLEYTRKLREVKYHETLFELLARQYEAARLDEAKAAPVIQVVDQAIVPDRKSGPPRTIIVLACGLFGVLVGSGITLIRSVLRQLRQDPENGPRLSVLTKQLKFSLKSAK